VTILESLPVTEQFFIKGGTGDVNYPERQNPEGFRLEADIDENSIPISYDSYYSHIN
jgi:hypothetical protein